MECAKKKGDKFPKGSRKWRMSLNWNGVERANDGIRHVLVLQQRSALDCPILVGEKRGDEQWVTDAMQW